jgi:hypothetical protein
MNLESIYPYKKFYIDIDRLIYQALSYKPIYSNGKGLYDVLNFEKNLVKYKGQYLFIITDSSKKNYEINNITDFFTEHCRVSSCQREYSNMTPFEYFNLYKSEIATDLELLNKEINYENLNLYMENRGFKNIKYNLKDRGYPPTPCSNYKITYLLGILKYFKPKRWLDMSAGWGDRLCSAYLTNIEYYYGIDPSNCLNSNIETGYDNIIKYFEELGSNTKAYIHKGPAESSPLIPEKFKSEIKSYDFIFTSPPFFTFEIYDKENENQSINQYNTIDLWLNSFLFKTIDRSWELLENKGVYLMYIEDKPEYRFINKMIDYMKSKEGCQYNGIIYQGFYDPKYPKRPYDLHTVYCFGKTLDLGKL